VTIIYGTYTLVTDSFDAAANILDAATFRLRYFIPGTNGAFTGVNGGAGGSITVRKLNFGDL
jgi:hypothetical protein